MFKVINEVNFLSHEFARNNTEYKIYGVRLDAETNGIVLRLRSKKDSIEAYKTLREMVRESIESENVDGKWKIKKCCNNTDVKPIEDFLEKDIYSDIKDKLKEVVETAFCKKAKKKIFPQWIKIQTVQDLPDDITRRKALGRLQEWLVEDKKTWEYNLCDKEKPLLTKPKPKGMRKGFLETLYEAKRHAEQRITGNDDLIDFTPYLARAFEKYWSNNIPKLLKKCELKSIVCSSISSSTDTIEKWELRNMDNVDQAKLVVSFKAPEYPYHNKKNYRAEICIKTQNNQPNFNIVKQFKDSKKEFFKRLDDVCYALLEYFHSNGMKVFPQGELNFKNFDELENWMKNIKTSRDEDERVIQLTSRWVKRGGIDSFDHADKAKARELLNQMYFCDVGNYDTKHASTVDASVPKQHDKKRKESGRFKLWLRYKYIFFIAIPAFIAISAIVGPVAFFGTWKFYIKQDSSEQQEISKKYPDGIYTGAFLNDKRNGHGTMKYTNGNKYTGNWKDDEQNGKGTYEWVNGTKYIGEWNKGKMQGYGIMIYPDDGKFFVKYNSNEVEEQVKLKVSFYEGMSNDTDVLSKAMKYKEQGILDNAVEKED